MDMIEVKVEVPDGFDSGYSAAMQSASALVVNDEESAALATEMIRDAKDRWSRAEKLRKEMKEPIDLAAKRIQDLFRPVQKGFEQIQDVLRPKVGAYVAEQRRKEDEARREAQRAIQEQVAAQREAERLSEIARQEEFRLKAEAEAKLRDGDRVAAIEAQRAANAASRDAAKIVPPTPIVIQPIQSFTAPDGVGTRTTWKFKVVDQDKVPDQFWMINEKAIAEFVTRNKDKAAGFLPGIEVWPESVAVIGGRR